MDGKKFHVAHEVLTADTKEFRSLRDIKFRSAQRLDDQFAGDRLPGRPEVVARNEEGGGFNFRRQGMGEGLKEDLVVKGLKEDGIGPLVHQVVVPGSEEAAADNDRNFGMFGMNQVKEVLPVELRHAVIKQNTLKGLVLQDLDRLEGIGTGFNVIRGALQKVLHGFQIALVIIHHQDLRHGLEALLPVHRGIATSKYSMQMAVQEARAGLWLFVKGGRAMNKSTLIFNFFLFRVVFESDGDFLCCYLIY